MYIQQTQHIGNANFQMERTIRAKIKYRTDGRPDGPRAWLMGKTKRTESVPEPEVTVGR